VRKLWEADGSEDGICGEKGGSCRDWNAEVKYGCEGKWGPSSLEKRRAAKGMKSGMKSRKTFKV